MGKGISPLVATVLLIAVTMTIAGALAYWASSLVSTTLPLGECASASIAIQSKNYMPDTQILVMFLRNSGPSELLVTNVTLGYSDGTLDTRNISRRISPGSLDSIKLENVAPNYIICSVYTHCPNVYASCL